MEACDVAAGGVAAMSPLRHHQRGLPKGEPTQVLKMGIINKNKPNNDDSLINSLVYLSIHELID